LSRAFPQAGSNETDFPEELAALSTVDADQLSELRMVASAVTVELINRAARVDDEYAGLIQQIKRGWLDSPAAVAPYLRPFYTFADELCISGDLAYKGHRLFVPQQARSYILDRLHAAHTGVNACQRRARETVYWPGITADIKRLIESCAVCSSHQQAVQKEPLMPYPAPERPWERIGVDICTIANTDYL